MKGVWLLVFILVLWSEIVCAEAPSVAVETALVTEQNVTQTLKAYGVLEADPDHVMSLSLPHAGQIEQIHVRPGKLVQSGDALITITTSPDARMQYLQAKSAVDYAQRELVRIEQLFAEQLATQSQLDAAKRDLADAKAGFDAASKRGQGNMEDVIRAPMDGIVTMVNVTQGQRVPAETNALLLAARDRVVSRLGVEPEDIRLIHAGTAVAVTPVFIPGVSIETHVREVHAMVDPATHLVEVIADIPTPEKYGLALGSRVSAAFTIKSDTSLVVPTSAVLKDDDGYYLFTVTNGIAHRVGVQVAMELIDATAISGPLKAGQKVVISGNYELSDGMAIREAKP